MIRIIYAPNRLEIKDREVQELEYNRDKSILNYIDEAGLSNKFGQAAHIVIVSGKKVDNLSARIDNGDEIIVTPEIKDVWDILVFLYYAAQVAVVLYSIYSVIAYRQPKAKPQGDGFEDDSPTYGWEGIQTTMDVGIPIPVVYGTHKIGGNIINSYISNDGDKNYLNLLIALCEGEIDSVTAIEINDQPHTNFDGIIHTELMGTNSDAVIAGFEDAKTNYSVAVALNTLNSTHTYLTTGILAEGFDVLMEFPSGMYSQDGEGNINAWAVSYKVEYKKHSDGDYTLLDTYTVSAKSRTTIRRTISLRGLDPDQYHIKVTRTSATGDFDNVGDMTFSSVNEVTTDNLAYPNIVKSGIKALATDQLSGATPNFNFTIKGRKISTPDIRDGSNNYVPYDDYYWNPTGNEFRKIVGDGSLTWDGVTYVTAYCANPVWCLYDLLTNTRFGLGKFIDTTYITKADWAVLAKYCDEKVSDGAGGYEKRFMLDIVLDSSSGALDCLLQICATFRGILFYSGGIVKIQIDRVSAPVQLFTMGNIIEGSFVQYWKSRKEFNNLVEVQYNDADKGYAQELVSVIDAASIAAGDEIRKKTVRLFTTRQSQALREAQYILNVGKYIQRSVTFKAGIDAIACQAGDVISIAHDVTQWGFSGRVQSGSTTTKVKLDRTVTIGAGYKIMVRFADDTIEEKTITDGAGDYTEVNVEAFSNPPVAYDVYSIGETNKVKKDFRILGLKRNNDYEVEVTAIEYDADLYDTDTIIIPTDNYSALETNIANVANLNLTEGVSVSADGSVRNTLEIWWQKPDDSAKDFQYRYKSCKIWLSDDTGSSYTMIGVSEGTSFIYTGDLVKGRTYKVVVQSVAINLVEGNFSASPYDTLAIAGRTSVPDNVAGFTYSWTDLLLLAWSPNDDLDLAGYEIRDEDANWGTDSAHLIYKGTAIRKTLQPAARSVGTYYIKAYNTSGVYSTAAVSITPTNAAPSAPTGLAADVFFNLARAYWADVAGADILYYEVYKSETNDWGGEETLVGKVSGRSITLESKSSRSGQVDSATDTTLVDDALSGLGDDYLNGDIIEITSGTGAGQTRTITDFDDDTGEITVATWDTTPDATSKYMIYDKIYIKVRGVDVYGVGAFTSALAITFEALEEAALGDNIVTARKIYVGCLSAISANMGCLTSGIIQGGTIQTGGGGARTVMDNYGIRSYDSNCCLNFSVCDGVVSITSGATGTRQVFDSSGIYAYDADGCTMFEVKGGCVCAKTLKLFDPADVCNYSYLDAGQLKFHDALGNVPYIKRICSGTVATGGVITLLGWTVAPSLLLSIRELQTYNCVGVTACQKVCIYNDAPVWYCTSPTNYGYCVVAHACLMTSSSSGAECVKDVAMDACVLTGADTCATQVKMRFLLWCNNAAPSNYYYGLLCYALCYRVNGSGTWCACCYCYAQPHANSTQLKTTTDELRTLAFPCGECWQIMAHQVSLSWVDAGICATSAVWCCYCCALTATACNFTCCQGGYNQSYYCAQLLCAAFSFDTGGKTIYCSLLTYCWYHDSTVDVGSCGYNCTQAQSIFYPAGGDITNKAAEYPWYCCRCTTSGLVSNNASSSYRPAVCICSIHRVCSFNATNNCAYVWGYCIANIAQTVCYCVCCVSGDAACCNYQRLYSIQDTYASASLLDPAGCLNWLAIAYN